MFQIDPADLFEAQASARGQLAAREDQAVVIRKGCDCLRLRSSSSGVVLEITHGPGDGSGASWIDLYSDPVGPDHPSLSDCIEYGLDLMLPGSNVATEGPAL